MTFSSPIDIVLFIIEIVACISFATSGAITALRKKADILGVVILTLIEVLGGGLLRDIIIGQGAPHLLWDPEYLILAAVTSVISIGWFIVAYSKKGAIFVEKHRHDFWIYALDAVGIAVFCVCGVRVANASIEHSEVVKNANIIGQYIYVVFLGVITGVGGGMFRDVFIRDLPMVFKKHFYMTPCIIGTILFAVMYRHLDSSLEWLSIAVSILLIVALRVLATIYKWNLPSAKAYNELVEEESKFERK